MTDPLQIELQSCLSAFDFEPRTRMVFEVGGLNRLGELAKGFGKRVLVVSDPGVVAAGHTPRGLASLESAGLDVVLFDGARENPTTENVESGLQVAREFRPDLIVGLGGGSSMDCAKGINFLFSCGGRMQDYWGVGKATGDLVPMIAVPTTAGTGSEMQSFALISDSETHVKMACGDKRAACRIAILDPELTVTQPEQVTALTGIDAISHAIETYVTTRRNPISTIFSRQAWTLLAGHFLAVLNNPNDLESRGAMQLGAAFAGLAIENSMLGAAHALANPLTARFDVPHGQAVGLMLPYVIRFNGEKYSGFYSELLDSVKNVNLGETSHHQPSEQLACLVEEFLSAAGMATRLTELDIDTGSLDAMATEAASQWTGQFNPRPVNEQILLDLYRNAN